LRLAAERFWLAARMANADEFVVQTPTMKCLLEGKTQGRIPVCALPFVAAPRGYMRELASPARRPDAEFDFAYVATGEPHKNHRRLIAAWCLLADEGLFPTLCLTLNPARFGELCIEIESIKRAKGIKVVNTGELSHADALGLYEKSGALIYPSTFESFGIPLIEARQAELPILASELDYVRDVVDPEQTFDPESPRSIARAVKRFLSRLEDELPLLDAHEFIRRIVKPDELGDV
jgi:glycosyltransferase involved in cell wall biosynthesis